MNAPQNTCPTIERLKSLLDGSLTEPDQSALQAHVDGCVDCQTSLETLVVGTESWDAAVGQLRGETPAPILELSPDGIQQMKHSEFVDAAWQQTAGSTKPLDFLERSDRPDSLGRLGAYEVTEVVGQGGMGIVLKAFDPSLHRVVAVKILAPYLAHNPQARKRFVREAQAIAAVCHDHVITIHAIDESAEQPKIVMQYVAGRSLQQKLDAEGSLDLKEILRIGMQTASGLAAAHAQGLVHRDVKPSNILLENGIQRVKLTDFGLARAVDDASMTQSGVIAGTPQYMAPEQANGDAVDHRADLFSLGSVMYAMCVGHSPFRASTTMGVLKRVCHDPPRPIQELNPDIPDWLCAIVMKLLAKKPEDRYPSAKAVAEVLEKWLAHVQQPMVVPRPVVPDPPSTEPPIEQSNRKEPTNVDRSSVAASLQPAYRSTKNIYASTIFFQPISVRWLLFFLLSGMTVVFAMARAHHTEIVEALMVSVAGGVFVCFWGMLLAALVRLVWANFNKPAPLTTSSSNAGAQLIDRDSGGRTHPIWHLPPESVAMLAALATMILGGHFLFAAIVAIIVWRVATYYSHPNRSQISGDFDPNAARANPNAESKPEPLPIRDRVMAALLAPAAALQRMGESVERLFRSEPAERIRKLLVLAWCFVAGVDLLFFLFGVVVVVPFGRTSALDILLLAGCFGMGVLSFAVARWISECRDADKVRGAAVIGLLPISLGAVCRIPLSIFTLRWQHAPDAAFTIPWLPRNLGRFFPSRRAISWRSIKSTMRWLAAWTVLCLLAVFVAFKYYFVPSAPSDCFLKDQTAHVVTARDDPKLRFSVESEGITDAHGLLPSDHAFRRDWASVFNHQHGVITILLGPRLTTSDRFRQNKELTAADFEELFEAISGDPHPKHATSLLQTMRRLSDTRGSAPPIPHLSITAPQTMQAFVRSMTRSSEESRPLTGFVPVSSLLDPDLFSVVHASPVSHFCLPTEIPLSLAATGLLGIWLFGICLILIWRLRNRTVNHAQESRS